MSFAVLAALLLQAPAPIPAADTTPTLQHREGLYVGVGVGPARLGFSCDGCPEEGNWPAAMLQFRIGVAVSPHFTVGIESDAWGAQGKDLGGRSTMVVGQFYPRRTSGLFLRGGVGLASFTGRQFTDGPSESGDGEAAVLGVGYDGRFDRKLSLTPTLTVLYNDIGRTSTAGFTDKEGVRAWMVALGIGMTWH